MGSIPPDQLSPDEPPDQDTTPNGDTPAPPNQAVPLPSEGTPTGTQDAPPNCDDLSHSIQKLYAALDGSDQGYTDGLSDGQQHSGQSDQQPPLPDPATAFLDPDLQSAYKLAYVAIYTPAWAAGYSGIQSFRDALDQQHTDEVDMVNQAIDEDVQRAKDAGCTPPPKPNRITG
jgi:hypothetical protein